MLHAVLVPCCRAHRDISLQNMAVVSDCLLQLLYYTGVAANQCLVLHQNQWNSVVASVVRTHLLRISGTAATKQNSGLIALNITGNYVVVKQQTIIDFNTSAP